MTLNHKERLHSGRSFVTGTSYNTGTKLKLAGNLSVASEIKITDAATKQEKELQKLEHILELQR